MKEFTIGKNDAGQRLDRWLAKTLSLIHISPWRLVHILNSQQRCEYRPIRLENRLRNGFVFGPFCVHMSRDIPGRCAARYAER